ncbi:unnamed protein product [Sphagnum jensenii]|uniref:Uncharacterized protein n=1 Tax=Sphagnum jensenii TaxID=128206 RepID=A0ABP1BQI1_9BRYO
MCGTYRCFKFNLECPGLKGFDVGDVVAQVPWGARRVQELSLLVNTVLEATQKNGNGNSNEVEGEGWDGDSYDGGDGYGINSKTAVMCSTKEHFEDAMTEEEQQMELGSVIWI